MATWFPRGDSRSELRSTPLNVAKNREQDSRTRDFPSRVGVGVGSEFLRTRQFSWEWLMYREIGVELRACGTERDRPWTCSEWEYRFEKEHCAPVTSKNAGKASIASCYVTRFCSLCLCMYTCTCDVRASCCAEIVLIFKSRAVLRISARNSTFS